MFDLDAKTAPARRAIAGALTGVMALGGVAATTPAVAAGVPQVRIDAQSPLVEVRDKWVHRDRRNWDRRNWDRRHFDRDDWDRRWHRHRHRDGSWVGAGIAGLAAGALLGGIIAGPRSYVAPGYYAPGYYAPGYYDPPRVVYSPGRYQPWSAAWYSYCEARYRSFDPRSGTFMGYDGRRHFCR